MNTQKCISDADLARLWEDDVTPQEKQVLQRHIKTCSKCKACWQRMSAGARNVENLLFEATRKERTKGECLSEDVLAGFVNQTLDLEKRRTAEEHLAQCSLCRDALADRFSDAYAKEGDRWWPEYVGRQILGLLAQLPEEEISRVLEELNISPAPPVRSEAIIKLSIFQPAESQARRLAAATGEGFSVQTIRQNDPAFEFELVQFGEQLRITARSLEEDSSCKECLARLELYEGESCLCSRVVLVEKGQAQCIFEPEEVRGLKPRQGHLILKLIPMVTLDQLASAGSEAYMPILSRLLKHKEAKIRWNTVEVIARICGPGAHSLIKPLLDDKDENVRTAVKKALRQFPEQ